jgi:hypothetical protein
MAADQTRFASRISRTESGRTAGCCTKRYRISGIGSPAITETPSGGAGTHPRCPKFGYRPQTNLVLEDRLDNLTGVRNSLSRVGK